MIGTNIIRVNIGLLRLLMTDMNPKFTFKKNNFMENSNNTEFLAYPQFEKFNELPFKEQLKEILHIRKVSELLFTLVTGETALTIGLKKHEHSVELQFESKQLVVVLHNAFFDEEYLRFIENANVLLVTLENKVVDAAFEKGIEMKHVSFSALKELVDQQGGKYMKVLVEGWEKSGEESINE